MQRMSRGLVCAVWTCVLLLASGSCTSTREHAGAGGGGKTSGGTGGEATTGGSGGMSAEGGKGGTSASGSGGETVAGSGGAGGGSGDAQCDTAADCGYGEIDHEIEEKSDCICRFGCPYIPLNKATIARRDASYAKLCDPTKDSQGKPCPIDDCVPLQAIMCDDHACRAAPR
jgi:hypothetical protein